MQRRTLSVWIVGLGLLIGLLGNLLFRNQIVGLSFPLFIGISIITVLALARPAKTRINWRNLWLLVPIMLFAGMVAVRADPSITAINVLGVFTLAALALYFLPLKQYVDQASLGEQTQGVIESGLVTSFGAIGEIFDSIAWLRERNWQSRSMLSVVRGLVIAAPIVLVFAALLSSADVVFADYLEQAWKLLAINPSGDLIGAGVYTFGIGWLAIGALGYAVARRGVVESPQSTTHFVQGDDEPIEIEDEATIAKPKRKNAAGFRMGMIESGIVLGLVDLLFAAFVIIQFAYFFGGTDAIAQRGLTYAEYARRGYFELVAVSVLTLGLSLMLDHITIRQTPRENTLFRVLSIIIVALTSVMLISASQRMLLYEEEFGFTHLRVYTHVSMLWLGVLFGVYLLSMFRLRRSIFSFGVLLVAIGYIGTLNLMDVDLYIAERNIARYREGRALDLSFLTTLSADALPAIIPLHWELDENPAARRWTGQWLARQLVILDQQHVSRSIFTAHIARDQAWAQLNSMQAEIPAYDASFWYSMASSSSYGAYNIFRGTAEPTSD